MKRPRNVQKRAAWLCLLIGPTMAIYFATLPGQMHNDAVAFGDEVAAHLNQADATSFDSRYVRDIGPELVAGLSALEPANDPLQVRVSPENGADDGALIVTFSRSGDPAQHNIRLRQSLFETQPHFAGYWTTTTAPTDKAGGGKPEVIR